MEEKTARKKQRKLIPIIGLFISAGILTFAALNYCEKEDSKQKDPDNDSSFDSESFDSSPEKSVVQKDSSNQASIILISKKEIDEHDTYVDYKTGITIGNVNTYIENAVINITFPNGEVLKDKNAIPGKSWAYESNGEEYTLKLLKIAYVNGYIEIGIFKMN